MTEPTVSANPPMQRRRIVRWLRIALILLAVIAAAAGGYCRELSRLQKACSAAKSRRQWAELQVLAHRWSMWNPWSGAAWVHLADAAQHQDRFIEAAEYLSRVPAGTVEELPAKLIRCKILMGPANQPFAGEKACLELLAREPRVAEAHELLIQFYAVTLQRNLLRRRIAEAIRLRREPPEAYVYSFFVDSLRLGQGPELCKLWLETNPDNEELSVAEILHRSDSTLNNPGSKLDSDPNVLTIMERDARELLQRFPSNTNLLALLIEEEITKGRVDQVIDFLGQSKAEAEEDPRFWRYQGWVHFVRGNVSEAERCYRKALALHPMDWLTLHRLAELERSKGNSSEVKRLEELVKRAHGLRSKIRQLPNAQSVPKDILREIGQLARDTGDMLIAESLQRRVGLSDPTGNTPVAPEK